MKKFFIFILCAFTAACSSMMPYKDQTLDYLYGIEKDPQSYQGKVVSFEGEVKGITEDTGKIKLVLKINAPLYYYATGHGSSLSYELLLVSFDKKGMPKMTGIKKGGHIKVLARVSDYEKRQNLVGKDIAVLHLKAFALADRNRKKDLFRPESPDKELYQSWKKGRLFFEEQPEDIIRGCPAPAAPKPANKKAAAVKPAHTPKTPTPAAPAGIMYDEEEPPFILPQDTPPAAEIETSKKETQNGSYAPSTTESVTPAPAELPAENSAQQSPANTQTTRGKDADISHTTAPAGAPTDLKQDALPGNENTQNTSKEAVVTNAHSLQTTSAPSAQLSAPAADKANQPDAPQA